MLKKLSLRLKLTLAFLLVAAMFTGVSVYQIVSLQHFNGLFLELVDEDFARLNALQDIEFSSAKLRDQRTDYQQKLIAGAANKTAAEQIAAAKATLVAQTDDLERKLNIYMEMSHAPHSHINKQTIAELSAAGDRVIQYTRSLSRSGTAMSPNLQTTIRQAQADMDQVVSTTTHEDRQGINRESATVGNTVNQQRTVTAVLAIVAPLLAVTLGAVISSRISRSLARLRGGAERFANGDFSQVISVPTHDEIGQLSSTFNHMAERLKESYGRLALEQQRDEAILKGMGEGLVAADAQGRILVTNKVAADILNLSGETAVVGKSIKDAYTLYDLNAKESRKLLVGQDPSFIALTTGQQTAGVYGFEKSEGAKIQLSISASPVKLDGKVVGVVAILRDVTKEKEVDRMKTEFISLASHQLRTPLSAIKWFSEMLVSGDAGKLQADQLEFAENIADSTERMIALVNALLNISRIESGRIMVVPKPTDLRELVNGIINDLKAKTEEKKQTLIISVHEGLPQISLDPRLIGQVYLNLLTNAIKYTPKGGEISVFISKKDDEVISQVTDNGYGIPKAQQDRVFQKFFRAANAVKVETDGTGLGLYLIKTIIESSGGRIWFESEEGKGTTFWFSIPMSGMKAKEGEVTLDI